MKITFTKPSRGCHGVIYIYDLCGLEYQAMFEEICMTKRWVDVLYEEEHGKKEFIC